MSFFEIVKRYECFNSHHFYSNIQASDIRALLEKPVVSSTDFAALLSDAAAHSIEQMAQRAASVTRRHFGHAVTLFTPMYISNYCTNVCPYCSFAAAHAITRSHLSMEEIDVECRSITASGIRHVLILTGEAPTLVPVAYLEEAVAIAKKHFSSVAIEIYPLSEDDYRHLITAGTDMLTLYQETYHQKRYETLHPHGPKADYLFRLDAPERACRAGIRSVTVGALLGLHDWRSDVFLAALHAEYLQKKYPGVEIGISFPRLRPQAGSFTPYSIVNDRQFVQMLTAMRIFLPSVAITMSTRESASFRMSVLPLGVTRMSAGVSTSVGGHSGNNSTPQFEIADDRDVPTICADLMQAGFQPVLHDWNRALVR